MGWLLRILFYKQKGSSKSLSLSLKMSLPMVKLDDSNPPNCLCYPTYVSLLKALQRAPKSLDALPGQLPWLVTILNLLVTPLYAALVTVSLTPQCANLILVSTLEPKVLVPRDPDSLLPPEGTLANHSASEKQSPPPGFQKPSP